MRARLLRTWTTGLGVALVGMVCGLAIMVMAVSADDGAGTDDNGCPVGTATPTATATQATTEQSSAAAMISLQSRDDQGESADCPNSGDEDEDTPGNSGAAHNCPFGGEDGESGASYRNHGECVSEAAHRRNEERRAAKHGTPAPTGTPTAAPTGTGSAAATAVTPEPGRGRRDREDQDGDNGRGQGHGGPAGAQGGAPGGQGNGHGNGGGRGRR